MKINFSQTLTIRGIRVQVTEGQDVTLGEACRVALIAPTEQKLSIDKMVERGRLALRLAEGGEIEIKPEEVAKIREALPNAFPSPELVVTIYDMLDPSE